MNHKYTRAPCRSATQSKEGEKKENKTVKKSFVWLVRFLYEQPAYQIQTANENLNFKT